MKDVIVSFCSKGREPYGQYMLRLIDSVKQHWPGDMLVYSPDHWLEEYKGVKINRGWPQPKDLKNYTHSEMPYQFKTSMIQLALEMGYQRIIWLDSSMQLKKDLTPLFNAPMVFFENLGHPVWKYISDAAFERLQYNISIDTPRDLFWLKSVPQVWGGAFSLNFEHPSTVHFFECLKDSSVDGSFKDGPSTRPGFVAHRHDQAVMSLLLKDPLFYNGKEYALLPYGNILCPPHDTTGEYGTDPFLVCRGL